MGRNQRIVRSGIKVFTCDVVFIKSEHNTLDGWALCNLNSHDPNGNLVCLSSCLCPKENCKGYNTMFDKVMTTALTEQDHDTERNFGEYLNSADCLLLSDRQASPTPNMTSTTSSLHTECVCVCMCLKSPHILVESVVQLWNVVIASVTIGRHMNPLDLGRWTDSTRCTHGSRASPTTDDVLVGRIRTGNLRTTRVSCVTGALVGHTVLECD